MSYCPPLFVPDIVQVEVKIDPDEKLIMEKMGFSNFTAKWQTELEGDETERWIKSVEDTLAAARSTALPVEETIQEPRNIKVIQNISLIEDHVGVSFLNAIYS